MHRSLANQSDRSTEAESNDSVETTCAQRACNTRRRMLALGRIIYAGYNKLPVLEISTSYGRPNGFIVVDL